MQESMNVPKLQWT